MPVLVDSNVILDMVKQDAVWLDWSRAALEQHADGGLLANAMIYAELCTGAGSSADVHKLLEGMSIESFCHSKAGLVFSFKGASCLPPPRRHQNDGPARLFHWRTRRSVGHPHPHPRPGPV